VKKLQLILLCLIALTIGHTFRRVVWLAAEQPDLFPEFQGVVLFLMDLPLAAFLTVSLVRVLAESDYRARAKKETLLIVRNLGGKWWLALLIWMWASVLWSRAPLLAAYDAFHVSMTLTLGMLIALTVRVGQVRPFLIALMVGAAGQSLLAVLQTLNNGPLGLSILGEIRWTPPIGVVTGWEYVGLYRGNGLTVNPNNLAGYLLIGFAVSVYLCTVAKAGWKWLILIGVGLSSLGLLSTMSRSALIGLTVAALPLILTWVRKLHVVRMVSSVLLLTGLVVILLTGLVFGNQLADRLLNLQDDAHDRAQLFAQASAVISQRPLLGTGSDNLMLIVSENRLNENAYSALIPAIPVHNVYWLILGELGIFGLVFFAAGCLTVLSISGAEINDIVWRYIFLAICITMFFDYYFWRDNRSRLLLFVAIGLLWGTHLNYVGRARQMQELPSR
jgi:O-antigen ligase